MYKQKKAFTLIELLVVISVVALLMGILLPVLGKARQQAQSIACRNHLKTLALANETYAGSSDGWYVAAVDFSMAAMEQPTWNSNHLFRKSIGLSTKRSDDSDDYDEFFQMPKEYLCPTDKSTGRYKNPDALTEFKNIMSYGYNYTDWGPDSIAPLGWSGAIPEGDQAARIKATQVRRPSEKLMFIDSGDIWVLKHGANYKGYWDIGRHNLQWYRNNGMWEPTFYRHFEGANIAFFDGHAEYRKKEKVYHYLSGNWSDHKKNNRLWYIVRSNSKL